MDFWRYLNKVGYVKPTSKRAFQEWKSAAHEPQTNVFHSMMHSGQVRRSPLNIEYIHLGACMGYIQDIWIEAMMSHPHLSLRRKIALVRAVNKILWIQNDLFARYHCSDGEEFADEMSVMSFDDQEGYLGDKRILGSSSNSSVDDDRSSISSGVAPSTHSVAPSTKTSTSVAASASKTSVCPFADMAKPSSTETKIWAN
jgi:hypothetical protein